jgi:hypothetical protein
VTYPDFDWSVSPELKLSFFDPDNPLRYEIGASASGSVKLARGLSVSGSVYKSLFGNIKDIKRGTNTKLPPVRSRFADYSKDGDPGLESLQATYLFKLSPNLYGKLGAGYLEPMFAGAGGEILYRPEGKNWAVGATLYDVYQRDFNMRFGLQDYHVTTGHMSFYWDMPWYGLRSTTSVGRYLAGDYGGTFQLSRGFDNGWEIGAFATLTNVPFAKFGEGSFDKGFFIRIPLEWFLPFRNGGTTTMMIRSLTRDGGQMLSSEPSLYNLTQPFSYTNTTRSWDHFWE